jgi:hypothetical protein
VLTLKSNQTIEFKFNLNPTAIAIPSQKVQGQEPFPTMLLLASVTFSFFALTFNFFASMDTLFSNILQGIFEIWRYF